MPSLWHDELRPSGPLHARKDELIGEGSRKMILGIPTLCRYDLLEKLILSAERGSVIPTEYLIIDNGGRYVPPFDGPLTRKIGIQRPGRNIGVAASWNRILRYAHGRGEPVVISNDDVVLSRGAFEELCEMLYAGKYDFVNGLGWALFGQTAACTEKAGYYDENFYPAYYEDCDYDIRLKLAGVPRGQIASPVEHVGWATTRELQNQSEHNEWLRRNYEYFCQKWGGAPGSESFTSPFDGRPPANWNCEGLGAKARGPVMRWDVLNRIARSLGASGGRYLEIGCSNGECLRRIEVKTKWGVDPAPHWEAVKECRVFSSMKSDEFFREFLDHFREYRNPGFDLVFIDSDHRAAVALEEIRQALQVLTPNGVIVLHDSSPSTEAMQKVPLVQSEWTGDVWKAVAAVRKFTDHNVVTVDTDYGCAVIRPRSPKTVHVSSEEASQYFDTLSWQDLVERRAELLGLISVEEFEREFPLP